MNKLVLIGRLKYIDGKKYISFRTESKEHVLPVVANCDAADGAWVGFTGQLHTGSIWDAEQGRYHKTWFGKGELCEVGECPYYLNEVQVCAGTLVKVDRIRTTPLTMRKILDFVVADGNDYFNCIAFGRTAERLLEEKQEGDRICIRSAMFHSRDYQKDGETKTAYEVCVKSFV